VSFEPGPKDKLRKVQRWRVQTDCFRHEQRRPEKLGRRL